MRRDAISPAGERTGLLREAAWHPVLLLMECMFSCYKREKQHCSLF